MCTLGDGLLGYAQFPGGPRRTDGVVVTASAFGTSGTARAPFDRGRTAVHEVGHWLNLRHIWGDTEDCSGSDLVADTPNAAGPNYGRPIFPRVSCANGPNGDMFMNFMDYVDDAAMLLFTPQQVARMLATLQGPRRSLAQGRGRTGVTPRRAPPELCRCLSLARGGRRRPQVFRPSGHPLPPSRGRRSLDLRRDGTLLETRPGADDRAQGSRGRWALEGDRLLLFPDAEAQRPDRELEVVALASDRLVLKPQASPRPKRARARR